MRAVNMMIRGVENVTITMMNLDSEDGQLVSNWMSHQEGPTRPEDMPKKLRDRNNFHLARGRLMNDKEKDKNGDVTPACAGVVLYPVGG